MINTKKHMLPFSPDVKIIPAYFFFSFQGFSERISCDPNPDSWSLNSNRRNEIICIAHLLLYKIMIYSFLSFPFLHESGSGFRSWEAWSQWVSQLVSDLSEWGKVFFAVFQFQAICSRKIFSLQRKKLEKNHFVPLPPGSESGFS